MEIKTTIELWKEYNIHSDKDLYNYNNTKWVKVDDELKRINDFINKVSKSGVWKKSLMIDWLKQFRNELYELSQSVEKPNLFKEAIEKSGQDTFCVIHHLREPCFRCKRGI